MSGLRTFERDLHKPSATEWGGSVEKHERSLKQQKEHIEDEMLKMAQGMKSLASGFS
jgi:hypothetical protein